MPIYDVENRFSYYKSYSDNILVGPSLPTIGSSVWQRGVSGSVVSGSEEYKTATILSDYLFKVANPFYKSGEVRYLRLVSSSQTFEDSITPSILELFTTGAVSTSGSIVYSADVETSILNYGGPFYKIYFSLDGHPITASDTQERVNNTDFAYSYPYEKKYHAVNRFTTTKQIFTTKFSDDINGASGYNLRGLVAVNPFVLDYPLVVVGLTRSGSNLGYGGTQGALIDLYFDSTGSFNGSTFTLGSLKSGSFSNPTIAPKLVFGINPTPLGKTTATIYEDPSGFYRFSGSFCTGSRIEGWKYGLQNGLPTNFSCVFRQNHYGQFRDMLEGRPYTKTYNNPKIGGPLDNNGGINFISSSALIGESDNWLTASIYRSNDVAAAYRVNPYGSGIFDKEYRASQPWFDNDPRVGT